MPPHPPIPRPLFHLPRRRLLKPTVHHAIRPTHSSQTTTTSPPAPPTDTSTTPNDYYTLLLNSPLPHQSPQSINHHPSPTTTTTSTTTSTTNRSDPQSKNSTERETPPKILFSPTLAGPSTYARARARGLARAESNLDAEAKRPPEPDNCCMSGCVNCVWEEWRVEVEAWAMERDRRRRREDGMRKLADVRYVGRADEEGQEKVGEVEGGLDGFDGEVDEESLFEGVDVGLREFMRLEKRVKERREMRERGERGKDGLSG